MQTILKSQASGAEQANTNDPQGVPRQRRSQLIGLTAIELMLGIVVLLPFWYAASAQAGTYGLEVELQTDADRLLVEEADVPRAGGSNNPAGPLQLGQTTTLTVAILSSPWAPVDNNSPSNGPQVFVVEAQVTNTGPTTATNVNVILNYNGPGWSLLPRENPVRAICQLAPGQVFHAYWFASYPSTVPSSHSYAVSAGAANASQVAASRSVTTRYAQDVGQGTGNIGVLSVNTVGRGVGFDMTVVYELSDKFREIIFSPAGNTDFDAGSYRLLASRVRFYDAAQQITFFDRLYFEPAPVLPDKSKDFAEVTFTFVAIGTTPTQLCPYAVAGSQANAKLKYAKDYCTGGNSVRPPPVSFSMTKQASSAIIQQGQRLDYSIQYANTGSAIPSAQIIDDTPDPLASIIAGSIVPTASSVVGGRVVWDLSPIPAQSNGTLNFAVWVDGAGQDLVDGTLLVNQAYLNTGPSCCQSCQASRTYFTTTVRAPAIQLSKTDGRNTARAGELLTYTLRITNSGSVTATGLVITDVLPADVNYASAAAMPAETSRSGQVLVWDNLGPIPANGGNAVIRIPVTVGTLVPGGTTLLNSVHAKYENEAGWVYTTKTATDTTIVTAVGLAITKIDKPDPVLAGSLLTYTLQVDNKGTSDAHGVVVSDTLPTGVSIVSVSPATSTQSGPTLEWDLGSLAGGVSQNIALVAQVDSGLSGTIQNTAQVTSTTVDPLLSDNTAVETTTVLAQADVDITKSDIPDPVMAGSLLSYTLKVVNHGPSLANGVVVSDTLPAGLRVVSVNPLTNTQAGRTLGWRLGSLVSGTSQNITITLQVDSGLSGIISNLAWATSTTLDPLPGNNLDTETTTIGTESDLDIIKTDAPDPAMAGSLLAYTLTAVNHGPSDAQGVVVSDTLPAGVQVVGISPLTSTQSGNTLGWYLTSMASGDSQSFNVVVQLASGLSGVIQNSVQVSSITSDPALGNNLATESTTVGAEADLIISKQAYPSVVAAGSLVTYTLTVVNNGPSDAQDLVVSDTVPMGVNVTSVNPVTSTQRGRSLGWHLLSLPSGTSRDFTVVVQVGSTLSGWITNTAQVTSATFDPVTPNLSSAAILVGIAPDLVILKRDTPDPVLAGDTLTYTLSALNSGSLDAQGVIVSDVLPVGVSIASVMPATSTQTGHHVAWDLGNLAIGASRDITIVVQVNSDLSGAVTNTAKVTSTIYDPNPGNNLAIESTTVGTEADLTISKSDAPDTVTTGSLLTYTVRVTSNGPSDAQGVVVSDTLPAGLSITSVTPITSVQSGRSLEWHLPSLASGASQSFTVVAQVTSTTTTGWITNTAQVTSVTVDPLLSDNTAVETTTVLAQADLALSKALMPVTAVPGAVVTFTLSYTNHGPFDAWDVTLTDTLPADVTYAGVVNQPPGWSDPPIYTIGPPATISWYTPMLAAGASGSMIFTVVVNLDAQGLSTITNSAGIAGSTPDIFTFNNSAKARCRVECSRDPYEPDDSMGAANNFNFALRNTHLVTETHAFHMQADEDWIRLTVRPGASYTFTTSHLGPLADTVLTLYASDGLTVIAQNDDAKPNTQESEILWTAPLTPMHQTVFLVASQTPYNAYSCDTDYILSMLQAVGGELDNARTRKRSGPSGVGLSINDPFTYTITLFNSDVQAAAPITVTDTLPPPIHLEQAALCGGSGQYVEHQLVTDTISLTWLGAIGSGSQVDLCIYGRVILTPVTATNTAWIYWNDRSISRKSGGLVGGIFLPIIMKGW